MPNKNSANDNSVDKGLTTLDDSRITYYRPLSPALAYQKSNMKPLVYVCSPTNHHSDKKEINISENSDKEKYK